ncbi:MAG: hypothetical protein F6K00_24485 [Leptolyngbya sp. SIOISBB]|nr:hypothetical protein [Leptolyngbya sp. SIOISBB]
MERNYTPPVSRLLAYGNPDAFRPENWPDYVGDLGLTAEHVPALLTLMQDTALADYDPDDPSLFPDYADPENAWCAPIHAWRSLAQLKVLELFDHAVEALQSELEDWAVEELVDIIRYWGPAVIEPIEQLIDNNLDTQNYILSLINGLFKLPEQYPETRDRVIATLMRLLENHPETDQDNTSFLAMGLVELRATEATDLLEAVYTADKIDESITGTWPGVQVKLGLKSESDFTEAELTPEMPPALKQMREMYEAFQRQHKPDAFSLGLPMDPSTFPSTKPPGFDDMVSGLKSAAPKAAKGFGGASAKGKKGKKKKR